MCALSISLLHQPSFSQGQLLQVEFNQLFSRSEMVRFIKQPIAHVAHTTQMPTFRLRNEFPELVAATTSDAGATTIVEIGCGEQHSQQVSPRIRAKTSNLLRHPERRRQCRLSPSCCEQQPSPHSACIRLLYPRRETRAGQRVRLIFIHTPT